MEIKEEYFLLGHKLPYSISPTVHKLIAKYLDIKDFDYSICETCNSEGLDEEVLATNIIKNSPFKGINVTNPHKIIAYNLCDFLDEIALKTKVCNTVVRNNGILKGYNTDYYGALNSLIRFGFDLSNKKVILIGNGATSKTLKEVLKTLNVKEIVNLVRTPRSSDEDLLGNYYKHLDCDYIINTTPYGTSPNYKFEPLFSLEGFDNLKGVFDCIYNPLNTPLIIEAKKYKVKYINGLYMLINQAVYSEYLFNGIKFDDRITFITDEIYKKLLLERVNIVFTGMPYSGKSYKGRNIAKMLCKDYIDTDKVLLASNHSLEEVLQSGGSVSDYRKLESDVVIEYSQKNGMVISTGGGVMTIDKNVDYLKLNSLIVYIHQDIEKLISRIDTTRPLVKSVEDLKRLYTERLDRYYNTSDVVINGDLPLEEIKEKIMGAIYEDLSY